MIIITFLIQLLTFKSTICSTPLTLLTFKIFFFFNPKKKKERLRNKITKCQYLIKDFWTHTSQLSHQSTTSYPSTQGSHSHLTPLESTNGASHHRASNSYPHSPKLKAGRSLYGSLLQMWRKKDRELPAIFSMSPRWQRRPLDLPWPRRSAAKMA